MSRLLPLGFFLLIGLAACGKRGPLEPPPAANLAPTAEQGATSAAAASAGARGSKPKGSVAQDGAAAKEDAPAAADSHGHTRLGGKKPVPITAPKRELLIDGILE